MATPGTVLIEFGHETKLERKVNFVGDATTTTTYHLTTLRHKRADDGITEVPISCAYPGCNASTTVRIAGIRQGRRVRRRMFGIATLVLAGFITALVLIKLGMDETIPVLLGVAGFMAVLPLAVASLFLCIGAYGYIGFEGAGKVRSHIVRVKKA